MTRNFDAEMGRLMEDQRIELESLFGSPEYKRHGYISQDTVDKWLNDHAEARGRLLSRLVREVTIVINGPTFPTK